ncbi:LacI family transcriptional regulator [Paenarthrobacter ureafaciens]|nr:LacI family DNA-binding transcriptional regulator [Paenarthrobacter ureafaciens]NWL28021.1 LacI family transcriptional regulator [Paenarthrobacter ureafaciens]
MTSSASNQPRPAASSATGGPPAHVSTIYDVAAAAGVNASTVSRALNSPDRVSPVTRTKVQDAARELNYRANIGASKLRSGGPQAIGLVVSGVTEPAKAKMLSGIEDAAASHGCLVLVSDAHNSGDQEREAAQRLASVSNGVIFVEPTLPDEDLQELARLKDTVIIHRDVPGIAQVGKAPASGLADTIRYLTGLGHRLVTYVTAPIRSPAMADEVQSLDEQCVWSGVRLTRITAVGPGPDAGRRVARQVRATGCTAVVCAGDLLAIGIMQELQAGGVDVPHEISVIGWGDIEGASLTTPPLSTIRPNGAATGRLAVDNLVELWRRHPPSAYTCAPAPELIVRGSSGAAPRA